METPKFLQGDSPTRLVQGFAVGIAATVVFGFNWGGWVLAATAVKQADDSARNAVVAALAPICVDKFQHTANAPAALAEFKKVASFQQGTFVEKGGWATTPGNDRANSAVAQACATMLNNLK